MNTRFVVGMNGMAGSKTELASLWNGPNYGGLEGWRSTRWANSYSEEPITKFTDEKAKDFNDNHGGRFWQHKNKRPKRVR
jgi:hypothetical protein